MLMLITDMPLLCSYKLLLGESSFMTPGSKKPVYYEQFWMYEYLVSPSQVLPVYQNY